MIVLARGWSPNIIVARWLYCYEDICLQCLYMPERDLTDPIALQLVLKPFGSSSKQVEEEAFARVFGRIRRGWSPTTHHELTERSVSTFVGCCALRAVFAGPGQNSIVASLSISLLHRCSLITASPYPSRPPLLHFSHGSPRTLPQPRAARREIPQVWSRWAASESGHQKRRQ